MAKLVGGFLMPHLPAIPRGGFGETAEEKAASDAAFAAIQKRLVELEAETIIIIGDDHYENFGPKCIPTCLVVTGEVDISAHAQLMGIPNGVIKNNEGLAKHIVIQGFDDRIDWAFSKSLGVDHSVGVPYHMCIRALENVSIVPIFLNAVVSPLISNQRSYELGESIRRAIDSWPGNERVVILGTGGLSHWVGSPGMGFINEAWDRKIMALVEAGDVQAIIDMPDDEVMHTAGNGALEIKNWLCALGVVPEAQARSMFYIPIPTWVTGCAFMELIVAA